MPEDVGNDSWSVPCSDEESAEGELKSETEYIIPPKVLLKMYETLDAGGPLPLQWKWPHGKRAPTDLVDDIEEEDEEAVETKPEEKSDFDFDDEASTPVLRKGRASGPKGSAKKKTTSFSGVLSNLMRHHKQEMKEKQASVQSRIKR